MTQHELCGDITTIHIATDLNPIFADQKSDLLCHYCEPA